MNYPYRYANQAQVSGALMSALFNHYRRDEVLDSLQAHGLDYFDADKWYPVDQFINLLSEWAQQSSFSTNAVSIGMAMIYHIELPDELENLPTQDKLLRLGDFFMAQHNGTDLGHFTADQLDDRTIRYTENTVWPDDIIYGYIYGAAQRYLGQGTHFTLAYADLKQRMDAGSDKTLFELRLD